MERTRFLFYRNTYQSFALSVAVVVLMPCHSESKFHHAIIRKFEIPNLSWLSVKLARDGKVFTTSRATLYDPIRDEIHERLSTCRSIADQIENPGNARTLRQWKFHFPKFTSFHVTPPFRSSLRANWHKHAWKRLTHIYIQRIAANPGILLFCLIP